MTRRPRSAGAPARTSRLLTALFLLLLIGQCVPLPLAGGGCDMPCCKRTGRAACCPRHGGEAMQAGGSTCRLIACAPREAESTTMGPHQPALLELASAPLRLAHAPAPFDPAPGRVLRQAADPPTPPPEPLSV